MQMEANLELLMININNDRQQNNSNKVIKFKKLINKTNQIIKRCNREYQIVALQQNSNNSQKA